MFIWLCQVLVAARRIFVAARGIFRCGVQAFCGAWALERAGSVVAAHSLSSCGAWALEQ